MNDYERVAKAIRLLDRSVGSGGRPPGLREVAEGAGLSPFHFQRLFSRWAGVSPKRFLQCLAYREARERLAAGESVLGAALGAGLSGPARLHDLAVAIEAATPGEVKSRGRGWSTVYGLAETPFGDALVAENHRGICYLAFVGAGAVPAREAEVEMRAAWAESRFERDDGRAADVAARVFEPGGAGGRGGAPLRAFVRGTAFQVKVWRALLAVPPGQPVSYSDVGRAVGAPAAARAVGSAVGRNQVAYLIPCHRVIRETGALGGYRWGLERKRLMLARELAGIPN